LPPYIIEKKHVDQVIRELDLALGSHTAKPVLQKRKFTKRSH